jgi:hypothetical protein
MTIAPAAQAPLTPATIPVQARRGLPWELPVLVTAMTLVAVGLSWDISWHLTIGRDSFWTPAHLAIYLGGATAGFVAGWMALRSTFFGSADDRAHSVSLFGARAPFGAWIAIWGAAAMLISAPFDNWWHDAYGLDVKIISPPHVLLFAGILSIRLGVWLIALREQNRPDAAPSARWLFIYVGALVEGVIAGVFMSEFLFNREHSIGYALLVAAVLPPALAAAARSSKLRWSATALAGSYMAYHLLLMWILPLFPASPRLGPIYNPVTHLVPPPFPQWLIVPALLIDWGRARLRALNGWHYDLALAALIAAAFVGLFLPLQWRFANFELSPAANNWFFAGGRNWGYNTAAGSPRLTEFWGATGWTARGLSGAFLIALGTSLIGSRLGTWMTRVLR